MVSFLLTGCDLVSSSKSPAKETKIGTKTGAETVTERHPRELCGDSGAPECAGKYNNDSCGENSHCVEPPNCQCFDPSQVQ